MEPNNAEGCRYFTAIIEDEPDLVLLYRQILNRMDMPVSFVAVNGNDALPMFQKCVPRPQVVLMDNRLPGKSGIEVTKEILCIEPAVCIIFLSADVGVRENAFKAGACAFIEKPAGIHEIMAAIRKALSHMPRAAIPHGHRAQTWIGSL